MAGYHPNMDIRRRIWPVLGILVGVVFAIEGITNAGQTVLAITGVGVGAVFALVAVLFTRTSNEVRRR